jgi:hypothetical protein
MEDTLLFLHILSAFALVAGILALSAMALGAPIGPGPFALGNRLVEIGGTGVLVFGLWIVFREDVYDISDGWILGAIVLWIVATGLGTMAGRAVPEGDDPRFAGRAVAMHWVAAVATIGILVLMVWKPGA